MKRISIAEQTLKKQYDRMTLDIAAVERDIDMLTVRRIELLTQRGNLRTEQERLRTAREAASERNRK